MNRQYHDQCIYCEAQIKDNFLICDRCGYGGDINFDLYEQVLVKKNEVNSDLLIGDRNVKSTQTSCY